MTTYVPINNAEIAPGKPVTQSLLQRLRDNILAVIEGDASAPKMSNAALATVPGQNMWARNVAGTDSLTIPAGITRIHFDVIGGGGDYAYDGSGLHAQGGGGERRIGILNVTPGETLTLIVASAAGASSIKRGATVLVQANGGGTAPSNVSGGAGGTGGTGGTGFDGARGGVVNNYFPGFDGTAWGGGVGGPGAGYSGYGGPPYSGHDGLIMITY